MTGKKSVFSGFYLMAVMVFLYLPVALVVAYSFNEAKNGAAFTGFTLKWYRLMMKNRDLSSSLLFSLQVAFLSASVSALIGTLGAVFTAQLGKKAKTAATALAYAPLVAPEVIMGVALLLFLSASPLGFGIVSLVLGHSIFCIPYIMIMVNIRLQAIEPSVIEAARDLGAGGFRVFWTITLPLIAPGILTGSLLAVAMSLDDVIISFFLTGARQTTLPVRIYSMLLLGVTPEVNALCTFLLLATFIIVGLTQGKALNKKEL